MKKISFMLVLTGVVLFASCDTKQCRCYQKSGSSWTGPVITSTSYGNNCAVLNNDNTYCNEMDDPILDPDDIAVGKKK